MTAFGFYTLAAGLLGAAVAAYLVFGRKKKTPAEIERERRDWLNQIGRITDGTVIDVQELVPNGHPAATMLIFQYDVGGVSYEASQDVTYLRQWVNLHSCRLGLPTSVRYDPQNPGNSIVVSERWSGLHSGTPLMRGIDRMFTGERRQPPPPTRQEAVPRKQV